MNRLRNALVVIAGLFLTGAALGGNPETSRGFRVAIELADGSRIIGTPSIASIPVQTTYAKMEIPLGEIVLAKVENDHEHIVLDLVNGDKLKGVLTLEPIKLETVFGKISIAIEHIKSVRVYRDDGPLNARLKDSLILHYSFAGDDGRKITDQSGGRNDGVAYGTTFVRQADDGGALAFDGSSSCISVNERQPLMPGQFTCGVQVKTSSLDVPMVLLSRGNNENGGMMRGYFLRLENGRVAFRVGDGVNEYNAVTSKRVDDGAWHSVCATYDAKELSVFVDGVKSASAQAPASIRWDDHTTVIGRNSYASSYYNYLKGTLDEVMIFNRCLSGEEIRALCKSQK